MRPCVLCMRSDALLYRFRLSWVAVSRALKRAREQVQGLHLHLRMSDQRFQLKIQRHQLQIQLIQQRRLQRKVVVEVKVTRPPLPLPPLSSPSALKRVCKLTLGVSALVLCYYPLSSPVVVL